MKTTLSELIEAYRKAKQDVFYERDVHGALIFSEYERSLEEKLEALRLRLRRRDWMADSELLGSCEFVPKKSDPDIYAESSIESAGISSDPAKDWEQHVKEWETRNTKRPLRAVFRAVCKCSVDWHIISALWIMRVGHLFDAALDSSVRGSRLRRHRGNGGKREFKEASLGCFEPYAPAYVSWREDGLRALHLELDAKRRTLAITADVKEFYHSVDASFLLHPRFQELSNVEVSEDCMQFHKDFVTSIVNWAKFAPESANSAPDIGLPVGLGAARIIANCALMEFDQFIAREINPVYYGRYVDDIFLVLRNGEDLRSVDAVWSYLIRKSEGLLIPSTEENRHPSYRLSLPSVPGASLLFSGAKQRVFFLEGTSGKELLRQIDHQVRSSSSEWRHLPEHGGNEEEYLSFLTAARNSAEAPDNLRKADGMAVKRLQFALHLRDLEAFSEDLTPSQWEKERSRFFDTTCALIFSLPHFFTFCIYVPRVFALAVAAGDWSNAARVVTKTREALKAIRSTCECQSEQLKSARRAMGRRLFVSLCESLPTDAVVRKASFKTFQPALEEVATMAGKIEGQWTFELVQRLAKDLFACDLAREPFRRRLLEGLELPESHRLSPRSSLNVVERFKGLNEFWDVARNADRGPLPLAICFPTRPFSPAEVSYLLQDQLVNPAQVFQRMRKWMHAIRGITFFPDATGWFDELQVWGQVKGGGGKGRVPAFWVPGAPSNAGKGKVRVCLPCLQISDESWVASASGEPDPDAERYIRTAKLINSVLKCGKKIRPDYVVLPELALKSRWFWRFARKLADSRISLISGIEYKRFPTPKSRKVANEVRASLVTNAPGYWTYLIYSQDKVAAAPGERAGLRRISGVRVAPRDGREQRIVRHGDFQFGILICSELTNIAYRQKFRGTADALFVPEWNRDIETFSPLIEASAFDLHLFALQSNNRQYGDCRIRAPYKEPWKRDIARIKGGLNDYFAIGVLDYEELRRFQSSEESPSEPFKPVPDGFQMDPSRRMLPTAQS